MFRVFSIFWLISSAWPNSLGQLLKQSELNLRIDPILYELPLDEIAEFQGYEALSLATRLAPIQLRAFSGYHYVSSAAYSLDSKDEGYESTLIVKRSQAVNQKLIHSFGWFLRNRLSWKISRDWVIIFMRQEKEFGLNSHFLAHQELVKYLDAEPKDLSSEWKKDWQDYQLDAKDAGFTGPMPSYQPMAKTSTPMEF